MLIDIRFVRVEVRTYVGNELKVGFFSRIVFKQYNVQNLHV